MPRHTQTGMARIAWLVSNIELRDVYIDTYMSNIVSAYDSNYHSHFCSFVSRSTDNDELMIWGFIENDDV